MVVLYNSIIITNKIAVCVSFFFLTLCILQFSIKKFYNSKNLYKKIAWISEKEPLNFCSKGEIALRDFELIDYIQREQNILNIPKQYCINFSDNTEKNNLIQILNSHKERVVKSYFLNMLTESDEIYRLENIEYYFYSLYCYISNILCEYNPSDIYHNKEYTSDCVFKCQLSDVGRVYYKLQLITQLYIGNNKNIRDPYGNGIDYRINNIKEHLDKNEVVFIHHGL